LTQDNNGNSRKSGSKGSTTEEENWRKERIKKDNHNISKKYIEHYIVQAKVMFFSVLRPRADRFSTPFNTKK
jgi:hypothetical protein